MQIIRGKISGAQKVVIYGPEGIGKSTFAAQFPEPLFIDTEGSTRHMDVARLPKPSSFTMLMEQVKYVKANPGLCKTLVLDTADWAEQLCMAELCAKAQKNGIEAFGYGKGYVYLMEDFGRMLNLLNDVIETGIHVVVTAHAKMRKFEQPDELGAYDRWELKLQKQTAPLLKEWADMVLFANYKTFVVNVDDQGAAKGKNKAQGGARVMYTAHHPCWDAKNRHGLKPELKLDYAEIAHCIEFAPAAQPRADEPPQAQAAPPPAAAPQEPERPKAGPAPERRIPQALLDLMQTYNVLESEIQMAVNRKGHFPVNTPIENYPADYVNGVLVAAWPQVYKTIEQIRKDELPF